MKGSTVTLSIIILNYNAKSVVIDCLQSIEKYYPEEVASGGFEVIIPDNGSTDDSLAVFKAYKKKTTIKTFHLLENKGNIGFGAGNNKGVPFAKGRYVLFLNSDTLVYPKTLTYVINFMDTHPDAGGATCKLVNKDGAIDFNCHRGFPTPWNSFCYFSGLQNLFPKSRLFAGYTQGWKDMNTTHEVDAVEGAFLIVPKKLGGKIGWWDEDYFFYGEDLQFSYDIKKLGYKVYYIGEVSIMHIGGYSSGMKKKSQNITTANITLKKMLRNAGFDAMKIFYDKNYKNTYPKWMRWSLFQAIEMKRRKTLAILEQQVNKE